MAWCLVGCDTHLPADADAVSGREQHVDHLYLRNLVEDLTWLVVQVGNYPLTRTALTPAAFYQLPVGIILPILPLPALPQGHSPILQQMQGKVFYTTRSADTLTPAKNC